MQVKLGTRLRSTVCTTEVVVVRAPDGELDIRCGGQPMTADAVDLPAGAAVSAEFGGGTQLGKRYADEELGIELLCTKAGEGALAVADKPLLLKDAKPLPASD